ncbi:hypothetical protein HID58_022667 [Brassica napus]|uniref:Uncharacterized protein n=1 Tax=Brassica napus TaxID=3708 RepID=A0ABQ8CZX1_BRANA|nr:hypothetical protein HID58_022667 [Brassica napus]
MYLEKTGSDHRPLFINVTNLGQRRTGCFMFDKRWCKKPEVAEIIRKGWSTEFLSGRGSVRTVLRPVDRNSQSGKGRLMSTLT